MCLPIRVETSRNNESKLPEEGEAKKVNARMLASEKDSFEYLFIPLRCSINQTTQRRNGARTKFCRKAMFKLNGVLSLSWFEAQGKERITQLLGVFSDARCKEGKKYHLFWIDQSLSVNTGMWVKIAGFTHLVTLSHVAERKLSLNNQHLATAILFYLCFPAQQRLW